QSGSVSRGADGLSDFGDGPARDAAGSGDGFAETSEFYCESGRSESRRREDFDCESEGSDFREVRNPPRRRNPASLVPSKRNHRTTCRQFTLSRADSRPRAELGICLVSGVRYCLRMVIRAGGFLGSALAVGGVVKVTDALEHGACDDRKRDGGVAEDFGEFASFVRWNKFSPGDGFGVSAAGESAPMHGLGTDAEAVVIALERHFFVAAASEQFRIDAELLRPVARYAAANGENSHALGGQHGFREVLEIGERIEGQRGAIFFAALALLQREVNT